MVVTFKQPLGKMNQLKGMQNVISDTEFWNLFACVCVCV